LLRLKIEDVLDNQGNIAQHLYIKEQKTHKQKKVKLNDSAIEALKFYFNKEGSTNPEQPLFRSLRSQKILGRTMAWRLINDWCKDVGLTAQRYGTHTLRKTWAYMARRYKSVPLELIQHKLGHSTPSITRRYIGITSDEIENVENHVNL